MKRIRDNGHLLHTLYTNRVLSRHACDSRRVGIGLIEPSVRRYGAYDSRRLWRITDIKSRKPVLSLRGNASSSSAFHLRRFAHESLLLPVSPFVSGRSVCVEWKRGGARNYVCRSVRCSLRGKLARSLVQVNAKLIRFFVTRGRHKAVDSPPPFVTFVVILLTREFKRARRRTRSTARNVLYRNCQLAKINVNQTTVAPVNTKMNRGPS